MGAELFNDVYSYKEILALCLYIFTMVFTPGPNNIMLTSSGANFGFSASIYHIIGISTGLVTMLALMSLGFNVIFERYPQSQSILFVIGAGYLIYLAYKIASSPYIDIDIDKKLEKTTIAKPMRMWQAILFQYVNPKSWVMCSNALIIYAVTDKFISSIIIISISFFIIGVCSSSIWTSFGAFIGRYLNTFLRWRAFNVFMAILLVACLPLMR